MLPTEAVTHPRVRQLRREWRERAESEGVHGLRLALTGLARILGKYERELALIKRKLREKEAQIERLEVRLLLAEDSLPSGSESEDTTSEAALLEEVPGGEKRSAEASQDSERSGKRFKEDDAVSPVSAKLEEHASETKSSIEASDSRKEEVTGGDFRREMANLGLLLRTQKRSLAEENDFHADLSADLLGCLTEEHLAWIGDILGHDDPHLAEVKDIYAELRKYIEAYPAENVQRYVGSSFCGVRSSDTDSDETSFDSSDSSDTDSMESDSDSGDSAAPSARFRKRRSVGNDIVELMIKKPRNGAAVIHEMSECLLPDDEWLPLQMYDRFRRMYC